MHILEEGHQARQIEARAARLVDAENSAGHLAAERRLFRYRNRAARASSINVRRCASSFPSLKAVMSSAPRLEAYRAAALGAAAPREFEKT